MLFGRGFMMSWVFGLTDLGGSLTCGLRVAVLIHSRARRGMVGVAMGFVCVGILEGVIALVAASAAAALAAAQIS